MATKTWFTCDGCGEIAQDKIPDTWCKVSFTITPKPKDCTRGPALLCYTCTLAMTADKKKGKRWFHNFIKVFKLGPWRKT